MVQVDFVEIPTLLRLGVDEDIVKIGRRELAERPEKVCHQTIERGGGIGQPLWHHQPLPQHTAGCTDSGQRNRGWVHEDLVVAIYQIEETESLRSTHLVDDHILPRDGRLRRNGLGIQLVIGVNNTPLAIRLAHTKRRCAVGRLALPNPALLALRLEESIDMLGLFLWQRPLTEEQIAGARLDIDGVAHATIGWQPRRRRRTETALHILLQKSMIRILGVL